MIKMLNLLPKDKILQQRRPPDARSQAELVPHRTPHVRGHVPAAVVDLVLLEDVR